MNYKIFQMDVIDALKLLPKNSVDAVVSDPPYGLEFMGKDWDSPTKLFGKAGEEGENDLKVKKNFKVLPRYQAGNVFQKWCFEWASALIKVMKPGAWGLIFGGNRTHHRLMCGLEDAGFLIKDELQWIYASGFPKSYNLSKGFDSKELKLWQNIYNLLDSINIKELIIKWKENSNNVKFAEKQSEKNILEIGMNMPKKGFVPIDVLEKAFPTKLQLNVIIAELKSNAPLLNQRENTSTVQENVEPNTEQLQNLAISVEKLLQDPKATQNLKDSIVQCVAKELQKEKIMVKTKEDEVLKTWLGNKKFLKEQDINVLCAGVINDLKHTILNQSKTFQNLDTTSQMGYVYATNVIITEYTAENLISFIINTLKNKAINKKAGVEREIVGKGYGKSLKTMNKTNKEQGFRPNDYYTENTGEFNITEPASDLAVKWNGFGTALKPAHEDIILVKKPLNAVPYEKYILCQLNLLAKIAEKISKLNLQELNEEMLNSVLSNAEQKNNILGDLKEVMAILQSEPKQANIALNMILLWKSIWEEILKEGNKFITLMENEMITELKILNSLIGQITFQNIILAKESKASGKQSNVLLVENLLKGLLWKLIGINTFFVPENAISKERQKGLLPKHEPIVLIQKPVEKNYCNNTEKHSVGGLNIDDCRIPYAESGEDARIGTDFISRNGDASRNENDNQIPNKYYVKMYKNQGRFPSNVLLTNPVFDEDSEEVIIEGKVSGVDGNIPRMNIPYEYKEGIKSFGGADDGRVKTFGSAIGKKEGGIKGTYSKFFLIPKANPEKKRIQDKNQIDLTGKPLPSFINTHPTTKPVKLIEYLIKLVLPFKQNPDAVVLDCFVGSGTLFEACNNLKVKNCIGIEKDEGYVGLCKQRGKICGFDLECERK